MQRAESSIDHHLMCILFQYLLGMTLTFLAGIKDTGMTKEAVSSSASLAVSISTDHLDGFMVDVFDLTESHRKVLFNT